MSRKYHIKKGDMVIVRAGVDKGQKGKVLQVQPAKDRALVEGINIVSKHSKPNQENPDGGIVKKEAPVHISNLSPIDPASGEPTRVGRRRDENGKLVRYAKKSGEEIK
jgi:large subunit ribosomal protein L24